MLTVQRCGSWQHDFLISISVLFVGGGFNCTGEAVTLLLLLLLLLLVVAGALDVQLG